MALGLVTKATSAPADAGPNVANKSSTRVVASSAAQLATVVIAGAALLQKGNVLTWDNTAKISVPGFSAASSTFASFVGQGGPIPVRQFVTSAGISLDPTA